MVARQARGGEENGDEIAFEIYLKLIAICRRCHIAIAFELHQESNENSSML